MCGGGARAGRTPDRGELRSLCAIESVAPQARLRRCYLSRASGVRATPTDRDAESASPAGDGGASSIRSQMRPVERRKPARAYHLTRYGWNFSVVFYGIIPSNPLASLAIDR